MDCWKFEDSITDYLDGLLDQRGAGIFREHALQCRSCRALLDDVKSVIHDCKGQETAGASSRLESSLEMIPAAHKAMSCSDFEELITEFLDGFVPASTYHRFEEHAAACPRCSGLLTDVVFAVASCHSVHTYEEYEAPEGMQSRLAAIMPEPRAIPRKSIGGSVAAIGAYLMPRATHGAPWSFATASVLAFATIALLILDFSEDKTVEGIYRRAHVKAAEIYSESAGIYAQKDEVVARLQRVGSGIGEIWDTLGGDTQAGDTHPSKPAQAKKSPRE